MIDLHKESRTALERWYQAQANQSLPHLSRAALAAEEAAATRAREVSEVLTRWGNELAQRFQELGLAIRPALEPFQVLAETAPLARGAVITELVPAAEPWRKP